MRKPQVRASGSSAKSISKPRKRALGSGASQIKLSTDRARSERLKLWRQFDESLRGLHNLNALQTQLIEQLRRMGGKLRRKEP
jgi:hypothetical protein